MSVAAACRGARIIERHFTLDKAWRGSDHRCSLDPAEMALLCRHVRDRTEILMVREIFGAEEAEAVAQALEVTEKTVLESELACIAKLGKTIVARRDIPAGAVICGEDVAVKVAEPRGLDPRHEELYLGKLARCTIRQDQSIRAEMLTCRQIEIVQHC